MSDLKVKTILNGVPQMEDMKKYLDLRNVEIHSREDLANICQIFRNPLFETFRVIYTRDNKIVGYESFTSRLPNAVFIFKDRYKNRKMNDFRGFEEIKIREYKLGANGIYIEHNHPAGSAKASMEDIHLTKNFAKNIDDFKGHVIVDHGTYAWIGVDDRTGNLEVANNLIIENLLDKDSSNFIDNNPLLQVKINSRNDLARIMYDVKHSNHYSTLVCTSTNAKIRLIQDIPNSFINMKFRQIGGYIKNQCLNTGSTRAFFATTDKVFFDKAEKLVELGFLTDLISYTYDKEKKQTQFLDGAKFYYVDQNLFRSIKRHDELEKSTFDLDRQERS